VSEQALFSFKYTIFCDCGRPVEECEKEPCFFQKVLYPFIEMRMDAIRASKHPDMPGFTQAEKKELRK